MAHQPESLVHTSIDDARSSIKCMENNGGVDIEFLEQALSYLLQHAPEQKTRRKLFESTLKRWRKTAAFQK